MRGKQFCAVVACLAICGTSASAATPVDIQRHWCGTAINTLLAQGLVSGYPDGRFHPDQTITREEAATLFFRLNEQIRPTPPLEQPALPPTITADPAAPTDMPPEMLPPPTLDSTPTLDALSLPDSTPEQSADPLSNAYGTAQIEALPASLPFFDVAAEHWSYQAILALAQSGILEGFPDGSYRPKQPMTRGEFSLVTERWLSSTGAQLGAPSDAVIPDISGSFAEESMRILYGAGILSGYPDGSLQAEKTITRAEAGQLLFQLSGLTPLPPTMTIPEVNVIPTPYISQIYPYGAWVGCEPAATLMGLQAKGYALDVTLQQFLDLMPKTKDNPALGFVGSPYVPDKSKRTRTTIYPSALAQFSSAYGNVSDFSGASTLELQAEILAGNPVVIYGTMRWEPPFYHDYQIEGATQRLLSNNHAVLVCGYDPAQGYYITDPYNLNQPNTELRYWKNVDTFERIYNERRHALVIR